jgi:hypothetical protein
MKCLTIIYAAVVISAALGFLLCSMFRVGGRS